jgi:hypothetical protein
MWGFNGQRAGIAIAFTLTLFGLSASVAFAQTDRYDCEDFTFQEDAQRILDQDPSDPNGLDDDNDGIACENLPSRSEGGAGGGARSGGGATGDQYQRQDGAQGGGANRQDGARGGGANRQDVIDRRPNQGVIPSTIPGRNLPYTGGVPLLPASAVLVAVGLVLMRKVLP